MAERGKLGLDLSNNDIESLAVLAPLTCLRKLFLSQNPLRDIEPLSELTSLQALDVRSCPVDSLAPLSALTALTELNLAGTNAEDLRPLASLERLDRLDVSRTPVTDLAPLRHLSSLSQLAVANTRITSIGSLGDLPRLEILDISHCHIQDLRTLAAMPALRRVSLAGPVELSARNREALNALSQRGVLDGTSESEGPFSVSEFICDPHLERCILDALQLTRTDLSRDDLSAVRVIRGAHCDIRYLQGIEYCLNLEELDVSGSSFRPCRLSGLESLSSLVTVSMADCTGQVAEVLNSLPSTLKSLNVAGCRLANAELARFLQRAGSLEHLDVSRTCLRSLELFRALPALKSLNIEHNDLRIMKGRASGLLLEDLIRCGVDVHWVTGNTLADGVPRSDKLKITIIRDECIGDGACCDDAPATFELDDDGIAILKEGDLDSRETIVGAARDCPTDAIVVEDEETGEKLVPES
jgi:Leucine-rich repeat (LRR) protein/ferredoxin